MTAHAPAVALDTGPRHRAAGSERLCAATGEVKPIEEMIRFVIDPTGTVVPDLKRNLPGRGIWITATRAALDSAIARKAFARSFRRDLKATPELTETTRALLARSALDALAIAGKAGRVAIGFTKAEAAIARGRVAALLHAAEAADDGVRKLSAALRRKEGIEVGNPPVIQAFTTAELDLALGRPNVVHAVLLAGPESETFLARWRRLDRYQTGDAGGRRGIKPSREART